VFSNVSVTTSKGVAKGFRRTKHGPVTFRGLPYGGSTAGENRWKSPQQVSPWEGERDCSKYGDACVQKEGAMAKLLGGAPAGADIGTMGDEVLNLNLVTPDPDGNAPVMCYIHGGGNTMGSNKGDCIGASPTFDDSWAERGVVAVSVNYRLALHGFLHIPEAGVTNLALRDLLAALEWIKSEVAAFGGDPDNVSANYKLAYKLWGRMSI
jgi:para-nitrobenzyl esterase